MKEIKAYIRTSFVDNTIQMLKAHGAPGLTIVTVHPAGYGFPSKFSLREEPSSKKCIDISKIELVCDDDDLDKFVNAILDCTHTGASGDGYIFVSSVTEAVKIRTLKRGTCLAEVSS